MQDALEREGNACQVGNLGEALLKGRTNFLQSTSDVKYISVCCKKQSEILNFMW